MFTPALLVILFISKGVAGSDDPEECHDSRGIGICLDQVMPFKEATKSPDLLLIKLKTLDDVCRKLQETKQCTARFWKCEAPQRQFLDSNWLQSELVLNYACGSGRKAYENNVDCWNSSTVGTKTNNCIQNDQKASRGTDEETCSAENNAVKCFIDAVSECQKEAVTVMKHFQLLRRRLTATKINCTMSEDDGDLNDDGIPDTGVRAAYTWATVLILACFSSALMFHGRYFQH